jgi:hypothetical protein
MGMKRAYSLPIRESPIRVESLMIYLSLPVQETPEVWIRRSESRVSGLAHAFTMHNGGWPCPFRRVPRSLRLYRKGRVLALGLRPHVCEHTVTVADP